MALPPLVVKTASPGEALGMAADRRNWGFRIGMELGSKAFHYDASGDMDYCIWTVTESGVTRTFRQNYTYDASHRILTQSAWVET